MTNNKIVVNKKIVIAPTVFSEEIDVPSSNKMLSAAATASLLSTEARSGELPVSGKLNIRTVYADDEILCFERQADFSATLSLPQLTPTSKVILLVRVTNVDVSGVANDKVIVTYVLYGYFVNELMLSFATSDDPDILTLEKEFPVETVMPLANARVQAAQSFEMKRAISKILCHTSDLIINSVTPTEGQYQVDGFVNVTVTALDTEKDFFYETFSVPYSAALSDNVTPESVVLLDGTENTTITSESGSGAIIVDSDVELFGSVILTTTVKGVCDAYCVENELAVASDNYTIDTHVCYRRIRERVSATTKIPSGALKSIAGVTALTVEELHFVNNFGLTAEGVAKANVIYLTHEGETAGITATVPFSVNVAKDYDCDTALAPSINIAGAAVRIVGSGEIEANIDLIINARGVKTQEMTLVSSMEKGEKKENDNVAISLYIVEKGETVWQVAKAMSATEDRLLAQNPDLELPLKGGEKILVYREL